jgi:MFS superfamily sulfate permease-like transporter
MLNSKPSSGYSRVVATDVLATTDHDERVLVGGHDSAMSEDADFDEHPINGLDDTNSSQRNILSKLCPRLRVLWSQLTLSEISGSLGDLGTLIPLLVALARQRSVFLAPALFWGGAANVLTGFAWDVPMCVQPMKSIAAVALAEGLTQSQVTAAGMWMGIFMTILGVTGLIDVVNRIIPSTVVSGLQMGVGLNLAIHGIGMITKLSWSGEADSLLLAISVSLLCLFFLRESNTRPHPVGVYLFLLGLVLATVKLINTDQLSSIEILGGSPIVIWTLSDITSKDWLAGLMEGAIPQLPLTTLNSVISVCCLASTLYPSKPTITRKEVAVSVGIMNLICCPLGAMPNCHGAGGLAGQHRFGARHGASIVFLGVQKMLVAIIFGASALTLLDALPNAILGVMLAITGQELATTGLILLTKDKEKIRQRTVVAMITTLVIVALHKTHIGALAGWLAHIIYGDGFADLLGWVRGDTPSEVEGEANSLVVVEERSNGTVV